MGNLGFGFFKKMAKKNFKIMNFSLFHFSFENKIARKKRNTVHNMSIGEIEFGVKRSPKG
jgi:hypothetical protein